jgi:Putative DNA-binding domain
MPFNFQDSRRYLQEFAFGDLFREVLGWSKPTSRKVETLEVEGQVFERRMIAELSGVAVYEVVAADGLVPLEKVRKQVYEQTAAVALENLLIFVDGDRTQSFWYWVKREDKKRLPRYLTYFKGQSGDLILGKISALMVDFEELENEAPSVVEVSKKLRDALDVERVTKKFYGDFKAHLEWFVGQIGGIAGASERRWYASVILNRLMFVYFLQDKGFVDGNPRYLQEKLARFETGDFYGEFLKPLFFEGFALAESLRSEPTKQLLGKIKYLNGGLFLEHRIEQENAIAIPNEAFEKTLDLFERYSWNLNDTPGGDDHEISPAVLGYIFEKYINQKEFGAYYTRPEITEYLCDRTINKVILDKVNAGAGRQFESIENLLFRLDHELCSLLLKTVLPNLSLLDPACGSGAFLVAAMKTLISVYETVLGKADVSGDRKLKEWLAEVRKDHVSMGYYIRKRIITDNLYGVDIMEEATEITKLRLFLALVSSAQSLAELEPLPNIDFNIMAGNSLIGLIGVDGERFDAVKDTKAQKKRKKDDALLGRETAQTNLLEPTYLQGNLLQSEAVNSYRQILDEKNASIAMFKEQAFAKSADRSIQTEEIKGRIDTLNQDSQRKLNQLLFDEFGQLGIKFEQAQAIGKPKKRVLEMGDIDRLEPFHWGYHFDQIIGERGGFDAIIANPPWEVFKPEAKAFFQKYSELVTKKKMDIHSFEKEQERLLQDPEIADAWLEYRSQFPHVNLYYRTSDNYKNQISIVDGKKSKTTDINLYKIFLERCFSLMKPGGECGIVIPSGLYSDLGSKQLREMLFSQTQITGLFCFENRKLIFEGVHRSFKFIVLSFCKGIQTEVFPAAFMRHEVKELSIFPNSDSLRISVDLIRLLSPDSLSVMEFKSSTDIQIAEKVLQFPFLSDHLPDKWNLVLGREFHMTDDRALFKQEYALGRLPLYEGKMIHQFTHQYAEPRYWIEEAEGRKALIKKNETDNGQVLDYQSYRLGFRDVAANTNERTMIAGIISPQNFTGNTLMVSKSELQSCELVFITAMLNSFVCDSLIRQKVSQHCNLFYVYQLPVPRLQQGDRHFSEIVERAAKLICTTPEFDDLATAVGIGTHTNGVTDETDRATLRAELDGMIAHLYHLTEAEFAHILSTFPIVPEPTKQAALEAYRTFAPPIGDAQILPLLTQPESQTLEFKSTARWNLVDQKKDRTMEDVILKTIAAFLNTEGGTLLIGVNDDGNAIGLANDYRTLQKKNRDGFELWLTNDLICKEMGGAIAPSIQISFHIVNNQEICKVTVQPALKPIYVNIRDKAGNLQETFFIRTGNSTKSLTKPSEINDYTQQRFAP